MGLVMRFQDNDRENYSEELLNSLLKLDKLVQSKPDELATIDDTPLAFYINKYSGFRAVRGYDLSKRMSELEHHVWIKYDYPELINTPTTDKNFMEKSYCEFFDYLCDCYDVAKKQYGNLTHYYFISFDFTNVSYMMEDKKKEAMKPLTNYQLYCILCLFMEDTEGNVSYLNSDIMFSTSSQEVSIYPHKPHYLKAFDCYDVQYGMSLFGNWYENFERIMKLRLPNGKDDDFREDY